jgi:hypothetical protein
LHPQATKHKEKRKKKRELDFLLRLGDDTHPLPKTTKQKEKGGELASTKSWQWRPPNPKPKQNIKNKT